MRKYACLLAFPALAAAVLAQQSGQDFMKKATFEDADAYVVSNDRLELTIMARGGAFANLVMKDDPTRLSPLWNPRQMARAANPQAQPQSKGGGSFSAGHFVCVDGFGGVSPEESKAGLSSHGEAHTLPWELQASIKDSRTATVSFKVNLPILQENFTRTVRMIDGENVIYVESELESLLGFDRPVNWGEHATIGAPFLEARVTAVDYPAERSMTRDDAFLFKEPYRFPTGEEFRWPIVGMRDRTYDNIRTPPAVLGPTDHCTSLLDRSRKQAFATAINPKLGMIIGWVFDPHEYPWLQDWQNYPSADRLTRGLEFATQPFDVPRRNAVDRHELFGGPTYRWLPAKSKIGTHFLIFFTRAPEGMRQVDDVKLENGKLTIRDLKNKKEIVLAASGGL